MPHLPRPASFPAKALALALMLSPALALGLIPPAATATTVYTGDRIDGAQVIDKLDVADLPPGITHLWFRVTDTAIGQAWYVPVIVIKGARPGARLLLTAGIHGDELNGIGVIQQLAASVDPNSLNGTLIAVAGLNTPGLLHSTRGFTADEIGTNGDNLNRIIPNPAEAFAPDSGGPATRYAGRLWSQLFIGNADYAIDFHTQSRGGQYPAYVFAQTAEARKLADLLRPDVINMDPGIDGALENMLNAAHVTAVTYELGAPETFNATIIDRAAHGVRNIMLAKGMLAGKPDLTTPVLGGGQPFVGNETVDVTSPRGGWAHVAVHLGQDVKPGDTLATVTDPFGTVTAVLTAPSAGRILSLATDPRTEPGDMVVRLVDWNSALPCQADGCPDTADMVKDN